MNQESESVNIEDVDLPYLWKTIEVALKGSLHPEPGVAFLAERLKQNVKESVITVGICFLDLEKLVD
jgi:hypothetical protein